jgi:pimeloyl-ACP methyl ester carboxylesterase
MRPTLRLFVIVALALLAALLAAEVGSAKTVWLCKPGAKDNPCMPSLRTGVFSPSMELLRTENVRRARRPKFDCFYVYPTVSDQPTPQADKSIDPELRSVALYQASRFSRDCRVYVPVYRQITIAGLENPGSVTAEMRATAYRDVLEAWRTYLRKHNHGRGVVLIGHSQGTFVLRQLVSREIDGRPAVRRQLISALLLGGGVTVKKGRDRGGDFRNIKACRSAKQLGCVIAFSTFNEPVPANSVFGRAARGDLEVLCTNPAALAGGAGKIGPIYPTEPFAPGTAIGLATLAVGAPVPDVDAAWISAPDSYRAQCTRANGASVLQISPLGNAPVLHPIPDASWGLHLLDGTIALGNLTDLVKRQAQHYLRREG